MEGILLIDKPVGPSSFDVVKKVRKALSIKKIGHAGTLDPLASGLMVVCLGRYTKFAGILTQDCKVYHAIFKLGVTTTTDDEEGDVVEETSCHHITLTDILASLKIFSGPIWQAPPRFSAVKIRGRRAYEMARSNQNFDIKERPVEIFSIADVSYRQPYISLRVHCSKGTYIRSLARDVGRHLGVGAYASSIRRVMAGGFDVSRALSMKEISFDHLLSRILVGTDALVGLNIVHITEGERTELRFGRNVLSNKTLPAPWAVACYENEPVAILETKNNGVNLSRVI